MNASEEMNDYARVKAGGLIAEFPRIEHVHVIMDIEKHGHIAELVVQARRHLRVEAKEQSDNMRVSLDRAVEKVEKQLRRLEKKVHNHRPHSGGARAGGGK